MTKDAHQKNKVLLIVRDGWGYAPYSEYNLIAIADTPYTDSLEQEYPSTVLEASGTAVGLPSDKFGNSEVGHMTIGAGRAVRQSLLRINDAINDESFFDNTVLLEAFAKAKEHGSKVHLVGLMQKEGVHAHIDHLLALLKMAKKMKLKKDTVCIHIITDGRDAKPQNAINYLRELVGIVSELGLGRICSLAGRYYAMDRNNNWERTELYYKDALMAQSNDGFADPVKHINKYYTNNKDASDRFLKPVACDDFDGIASNDVIISYNFRKDRARQLASVFADADFSHFERVLPSGIHLVAMTDYYNGLKNVAYEDLPVTNTLGKVLAEAGLSQLRIAETEKAAHVTYFFDGGIDVNLNKESKIIVASPKVATYDEQPEMAIFTIAESLNEQLSNAEHDFILCNLANADMVGHTGNKEATIKAVEAVDIALERVIPHALSAGYTILLTADHGNAEHKHDKFETSHTMNPVQFTIVSKDSVMKRVILDESGSLANIASTVLGILKIQIQKEYESSLIV